MIRFTIKQFVKKNNFRLIFFVLLGLFNSENGFAQKHWIKERVQITWCSDKKCILIAAGVYDYLFGPKSEHGYLYLCNFEASVDNNNYFKLMEMRTPYQNKSRITRIKFKNKFNRAVIMFLNDIVSPTVELIWRERFRNYTQVRVPNAGNM